MRTTGFYEHLPQYAVNITRFKKNVFLSSFYPHATRNVFQQISSPEPIGFYFRGIENYVFCSSLVALPCLEKFVKKRVNSNNRYKREEEQSRFT